MSVSFVLCIFLDVTMFFGEGRLFGEVAGHNSGTRIDAFAFQIVVWTLSVEERNEPSAFSQWDGGRACRADGVK